MALNKGQIGVFKGFPHGWGIKDSLNETTDPGNTDDETKKYSVNSKWINQSTDKIFTCTKNLKDNANWEQLN